MVKRLHTTHSTNNNIVFGAIGGFVAGLRIFSNSASTKNVKDRRDND
jgi:hypothetical protein